MKEKEMKKIYLILLIAGLTTAQHTKHSSPIMINDAWIRPVAAEANTAFFFEAVNGSDKTDSLIAAEFKFAEAVEVHETYKKSEDVMGMRAVKAVAIPAKATIKFKPRDLHVMLLNLFRDIKRGQKYNLTLIFKRAGRIKVDAVVRDMPK
jgi:periplasmic copper chaperone A